MGVKAGLGQILRKTKRLLEGVPFPHWCRVQTRMPCLFGTPSALSRFAMRWAICISPGAVCAEESYPNPEVPLAGVSSGNPLWGGGRGGLEHGSSLPCQPQPGQSGFCFCPWATPAFLWFLRSASACAVPTACCMEGASIPSVTPALIFQSSA